MWSYILKRLLLMIPTLARDPDYHLRDHPVRAGRPGRADGGAASGPRGGGRGRPRDERTADTAGARASMPSRVEEIKKLYGFDKPAHERFLQMLGQFARFDLGKSFFHNKDVGQLIKEKLPVSISLGIWTFLLVYRSRCRSASPRRCGPGRASTRSRPSSCSWVTRSRVSSWAWRCSCSSPAASFVQWFPLRGLTSTNWGELEPARQDHRLLLAHRACRSARWCWAASPSSRYSPRTRCWRRSASSTC